MTPLDISASQSPNCTRSVGVAGIWIDLGWFTVMPPYRKTGQAAPGVGGVYTRAVSRDVKF